eukprot:6645538-Prymnesium_polylepis.1
MAKVCCVTQRDPRSPCATAFAAPTHEEEELLARARRCRRGAQNMAATHNPNNDLEVPNAADDGISCVAWSPVANHIVAGSWDNQVRCWEVQPTGQAVPKAATSHTGPVLCASWSNDGARVFTGSADKTAKVWDLATSQATQVAAHDQPIKNISWVQELGGGCIVTSSWDRTVKYWDGKTPNPSATLQLPERAFCMDVRYPLLVVATADRKIIVVNLSNPTAIFKAVDSPLKYQSRCVACFPDQQVRAAPCTAASRATRRRAPVRGRDV